MMGSRGLARIVSVTAAAVIVGLVGATPARADVTISINKGNVPTTAAGFSNHDCDPNFGGGPFADKDVWVFVLPDKDADFVTVTATFSKPGGATTSLTIPDDGGAIVNDKGTSKAWIATPKGWTLTGATAVITGDDAYGKFFNLTHTCPAKGSSPSPSTSVSSSASASASAPASPAPSASGTAGGGNLPVTGPALAGMLAVGAGLVLGGIALLVARRRRDAGSTL
jgi:LPXTG-motif cell wall-anchored protein